MMQSRFTRHRASSQSRARRHGTAIAGVAVGLALAFGVEGTAWLSGTALSKRPDYLCRSPQWRSQTRQTRWCSPRSDSPRSEEPVEPQPQSQSWVPRWLSDKLPKLPTPEQIKKLGAGMALSYLFLGTLNSCAMVIVSWPVFILRTGVSPIIFEPFSMNPQYMVSLGVIYMGYGTLTTAPLAAGAAALSPLFARLFAALRRRLGRRKWLAIVLLIVGYVVSFSVFLVSAIVLACAICHVPVL
eukprot:CAMPEP_0170617940 /NCGR_PEP_ID=MMETSP0224-20130122/26691_1 /TAXON_ID=285029 /ORGANISM="Togula jolla, Strain CCCM 725" /LENGTH=241 /DNA_ID=CAMNT_0010943877 /DNA_START=61 /DNA_END=782 /DNA_ORIENTATION=+